MNPLHERLQALVGEHPKLLKKGGLCVALVVTRTAQSKGLPLNPEALRTDEGGQVAGLGKGAVQGILNQHGIVKVLAEEGGRTSRGSLGLMAAYVAVLNELHQAGVADLEAVMEWWIEKVKLHFASEGPMLSFDPSKSVAANLSDLFSQAAEIQGHSGGANYVGAMLQHLVGAKMELVLGLGAVEHHGFSTSDQSTGRSGDFEINSVAVHVTTHPSEALIRKTESNLKQGKKPVIITLSESVAGAKYLLKETEGKDRVDVLDISQFLTANIYERSLFQANECQATLEKIVTRYNEIVAACETDPVLRIRM